MEINIPEWDNNNSMEGQVNRMTHMVSMANVHKELVKIRYARLF